MCSKESFSAPPLFTPPLGRWISAQVCLSPEHCTPPTQKSGSQHTAGSSCQHFDASPGPAEGSFVISLIGPGLQFILTINYRNVVGLAFSNQIRFFSQERLAGPEIAALLQCMELQILLAPANWTALCIDI